MASWNRTEGACTHTTPEPVLLVTNLFIAQIIVMPSDEGKSVSVHMGWRSSVWGANASKTVNKLSTLPINKTKSVSLARVFLHSLFLSTYSVSLSLSLTFSDLCAPLGSHAMESLLWGEFKGSIMTFYMCRRIIKTKKQQKEKT